MASVASDGNCHCAKVVNLVFSGFMEFFRRDNRIYLIIYKPVFNPANLVSNTGYSWKLKKKNFGSTCSNWMRKESIVIWI